MGFAAAASGRSGGRIALVQREQTVASELDSVEQGFKGVASNIADAAATAGAQSAALASARIAEAEAAR